MPRDDDARSDGLQRVVVIHRVTAIGEWQRVYRQGSTPVRIRTCIATRTRCSDTRMLRVVLRQDGASQDGSSKKEAVIIPDPSRSLPGRGAWIIPTAENFERARQRRTFERALRVSGKADTRQIGEYIESLESGSVTPT